MSINRKHIEKIFKQKSSLTDQKKLEEYFISEELNAETKEILKEQWESFEAKQTKLENFNPIFHRIYYTISQLDDKPQKRKVFLRILQVAAAFIVGILIASAVYYSSNYNAVEPSTHVEFVSTTGFRNQFKLPDGTTGWLGQDSKIKYHLNRKGQRFVKLDGLAYFDVSRNPQRPFIVNTPSNLDVKVLGTRFNISSYTGDEVCEVVLEKGSVSLSLEDRNLGEMNPNERVVYHPEKNSFTKTIVNALDYIAWKDGKLIFNDASLEEACFKLGKFYNADFELQVKELSGQKVRLHLEDESLEEALRLISMLMPLEYKIEERKMNSDNSYSKKKVIIKNKLMN